jgi:Transposase
MRWSTRTSLLFARRVPHSRRRMTSFRISCRWFYSREGHRLDTWLEQVESSDLSELHSFATGVERDKAAVQAGLTWWINHGVVEGSVTKGKLIKRQMYGRAGFALLRQRVLHALSPIRLSQASWVVIYQEAVQAHRRDVPIGFLQGKHSLFSAEQPRTPSEMGPADPLLSIRKKIPVLSGYRMHQECARANL